MVTAYSLMFLIIVHVLIKCNEMCMSMINTCIVPLGFCPFVSHSDTSRRCGWTPDLGRVFDVKCTYIKGLMYNFDTVSKAKIICIRTVVQL